MSDSLIEARAYIMRDRFGDGVHCPVCDQFAKVYRRRLNASMVRALIDMYKAGGIRDYVHTPTLLKGRRGEEARLSYWELTEELTERREDGGKRGYWRVTRRGELFLHGVVTVPAYALVYDSQLLRLGGEPTNVLDALGTKFDLAELMAPAEEGTTK